MPVDGFEDFLEYFFNIETICKLLPNFLFFFSKLIDPKSFENSRRINFN